MDMAVAMPGARLMATIFTGVLLATTTQAQPALQPVRFTDTRLSNGLRVIIVEDRYAPVFAIAVSYGVGSKDERPGRTGFAHLFEHMMFEGSENVGPGEHFFLVFNNGGSMNATVNTDRTLYHEVFPKNQLDLGLFLEADRMRSLKITVDNLDNQRRAVQEERRLRVDNQPYGRSQERLNEIAFDNDAYGHPVIGSMEDLDAATVDDVASFFKTYYAPNNAALTLVGDLDTKATLVKVEKYFGSIPRQEPPKPVDVSEPAMKGERRDSMVDPLARLAEISIGYKIPPATHPDWPALSALGQILANGDSSRLHQAVVKDEELCMGVGALVGARIGPSLLTVTCSVRAGKNLAEAEASISKVIAAAHSAPVTDLELQRVRTSARLAAVSTRQSVLSRAISLADNAVLYDDPNRINTETQSLSAVTAADLHRVARTYLHTDNRIVMHTVPGPGTSTARPVTPAR